MGTNGAMAAAVPVPAAAGLDAAAPGLPGLPGPGAHPASTAVSPAPHAISIAARVSGRLPGQFQIANSINPSLPDPQFAIALPGTREYPRRLRRASGRSGGGDFR